MKYDIFISYRHDGGEDKARIVHQYLSAQGYNVFFDHDAGRNTVGQFETVILAAIEVAPLFIFMLTPNCFEKCTEEGNWVRREIEHAIKFEKDIIPIRPNYEFDFGTLPSSMPEAIMKLADYEFAEVDFRTHFKATANEMVANKIRKIVEPSISIAPVSNVGAKIHFFSDLPCRVMAYGKQIAITGEADKSIGAVARLLKGRHMLEYRSLENENDTYSEVYVVEGNDIEDFVNVSLGDIRRKRLRREVRQQRIDSIRVKITNILQRKQYKKVKGNFFFIYSRNDALIVRYVKQQLELAGHRCWVELDINAGVSFQHSIESAISECDNLLYFHSHATGSSEWVKHELMMAISMDKKIIPIRLDDSPYPYEISLELNRIQCYQLDAANVNSAVQHMVNDLNNRV